MILGTLAAAAMYRFRFFGKEGITLLILLPIALPGIVTGICAALGLRARRHPFSYLDDRARARHLLHRRRLQQRRSRASRRSSPALIEASMDLGADGFQTFRYVILPSIATALLAGGMLAFALSFDEVIVTTFTAGQQSTLPIWMLSGAAAPAAAAGDQRRRRLRHRGHVHADPAPPTTSPATPTTPPAAEVVRLRTAASPAGVNNAGSRCWRRRAGRPRCGSAPG